MPLERGSVGAVANMSEVRVVARMQWFVKYGLNDRVESGYYSLEKWVTGGQW